MKNVNYYYLKKTTKHKNKLEGKKVSNFFIVMCFTVGQTYVYTKRKVRGCTIANEGAVCPSTHQID